MAPPCDAACMKIIINTGFMAALAPVLATHTGYHPIRAAATRLAEVAEAYSKMLAAVGVAINIEGDWEGCEQAKKLMQWSEEDPASGDVADKLLQIEEWIVAIWSAIAELAAGKMPTA